MHSNIQITNIQSSLYIPSKLTSTLRHSKTIMSYFLIFML